VEQVLVRQHHALGRTGGAAGVLQEGEGVAVDVRAGSPTFLKWHAERLSEDNQHALLIPEGFAHGFQAITDNVELLYCHSAPYVPGHEAALNPLDMRLGIPWPLPVTEMSERDRNYPMLSDSFEGIAL
jgi:dTDP-4-dehydrorhamnose 3,5-epimerase